MPHPTDEADLREPVRPLEGGPLRADISREIVSFYKRNYGKGPTRCRTYLEPDMVIVVLGEGYTAAEQALFDAGRWHEVRAVRMHWQDSMEARFTEIIERLTDRKVAAFMSANRQNPDMAVELFVLANDPA